MQVRPAPVGYIATSLCSSSVICSIQTERVKNWSVIALLLLYLCLVLWPFPVPVPYSPLVFLTYAILSSERSKEKVQLHVLLLLFKIAPSISTTPYVFQSFSLSEQNVCGRMWTCRLVNPKPRKEAAPNRLYCCFLSVTTAVKAPSLCQPSTMLCGFLCLLLGTWVFRSRILNRQLRYSTCFSKDNGGHFYSLPLVCSLLNFGLDAAF